MSSLYIVNKAMSLGGYNTKNMCKTLKSKIYQELFSIYAVCKITHYVLYISIFFFDIGNEFMPKWRKIVFNEK